LVALLALILLVLLYADDIVILALNTYCYASVACYF